MILVFGSFILGGQRVIKEFGIGLAAGILVDAIFIRMAIVPSIMMLFGKANWWFPAWLDRILPRLAVDADDIAAHPAAVRPRSGARAGRAAGPLTRRPRPFLHSPHANRWKRTI